MFIGERRGWQVDGIMEEEGGTAVQRVMLPSYFRLGKTVLCGSILKREVFKELLGTLPGSSRGLGQLLFSGTAWDSSDGRRAWWGWVRKAGEMENPPTPGAHALLIILSSPDVPGEGAEGRVPQWGERSRELERGPICVPAAGSYTEQLERAGRRGLPGPARLLGVRGHTGGIFRSGSWWW